MNVGRREGGRAAGRCRGGVHAHRPGLGCAWGGDGRHGEHKQGVAMQQPGLLQGHGCVGLVQDAALVDLRACTSVHTRRALTRGRTARRCSAALLPHTAREFTAQHTAAHSRPPV